MNSIKKLLEIETIKNNKMYFIAKIVLSLLIAFSFFLDSISSFGNWHAATYKEAFFIEPSFFSIIIFFLIFCLSFLIIGMLSLLYQKIDYSNKCMERKKNKRFFIITFLIIFIIWLPVTLSYVPGGIFDDTYETILMVRGEEPLTNHHPLLYSGIIKFFIWVGENFFGDFNIGFVLYTITQILLMIAVITCFITWFYKIGISKKYIVCLITFCSFFYLFPLYAVSIWKDTPYCIAILWYTLIIAKIVYSKGKKLTEKKFLLQYIISMLLVAFFRNNGLYIVIPTTFAIIIKYRRVWSSKIFNKISSLLILPIITTILIQGPLYNMFHINTEFRESVGILIQQICYVVANDGNISDEELEFINNIEKIENIKTRYSPYNVDMIKFYEFNDEFLEKNKSKFFFIWLKLLLKNPQMYIKAYLLNTTGYWDLVKAENSYSKNYIYPRSVIADFFNEYWQVDFIEMITGKSIRNFWSIIIIPYAWFGVFILLSVTYCIRLKRYQNIIILLPALLTLVTVFIAVPIAFSMRYVFSLAMVMPFSVCFPFLVCRFQPLKEDITNEDDYNDVVEC